MGKCSNSKYLWPKSIKEIEYFIWAYSEKKLRKKHKSETNNIINNNILIFLRFPSYYVLLFIIISKKNITPEIF